MKKVIVIFLLSIKIFTVNGQSKIQSPSSFFPEKQAKILVVGTFHFDYPELDVVKTNASDRIDVLTEPKKGEVSELVAYIKQFKPTKIAIEAKEKWNAPQKLEEYKQGKKNHERDERFQLAFRLIKELGLDTVYSVDAEDMVKDVKIANEKYVENLLKDFDFKTDDPFNEYINNWVNYGKKLIPETNLIEYFKYLNSEEVHQYNYGTYLTGDFKLDNYRGADILSIWWYNRNLRIFRKIQKITTGTEDRILVLIGNGHAAVLRQLIKASPEVEFVEFDSLNDQN